MIANVAFVKITSSMLDLWKYFNSISSAKCFLLLYLFVTFDRFELGLKRPSFAVDSFLGKATYLQEFQICTC